MCSSIQVFLLFSSCSVGDAILFFTCSFCVFVLVFTTIRKRWTSTTFLHCQRDCFYTEFVGCILLLWSCHSREWFLFFFLNTCCVDTEKKKMVKDCSEFPFKTEWDGSAYYVLLEQIDDIHHWGNLTFQTNLFPCLCDCLLTCGHF